MANNEPKIVELSPSLKERILSSFFAIVTFIVGIIIICAALILQLSDTVQFFAIFFGALLVLYATWKILRIALVKLYINLEEIRYRDRFIWRKISWSEIISVGRANAIKTKNHNSVLKKIKALLFLTKNGLKEFDMRSYSLTHGIEISNMVIDSNPKMSEEDKSSSEE